MYEALKYSCGVCNTEIKGVVDGYGLLTPESNYWNEAKGVALCSPICSQKFSGCT